MYMKFMISLSCYEPDNFILCKCSNIKLNLFKSERLRQILNSIEELNQSLRQRDKVKDDAIAQLSDQLVSLSARLQEIERRQPT
jgi:hypothetical protein